MFFKKLFAKPYRHYREQGDRLFAEERFAEARAYYLEAQERLHECAVEREQEEGYLRDALIRSGNELASLNLVEAESAIHLRDFNKAHDHLTLTLELAEDVTLREKAEKLLQELSVTGESPEPMPSPATGHHCSGCGHDHAADSNKTAPLEAALSNAEQFQLLLNTLPGDLPARYAAMGEEFAYAYMAAHAGNAAGALAAYERLASTRDMDILLYETAIASYQLGREGRCEELLGQALGANPLNPLCNLGLAQLYSRAGRFEEAIGRLQQMLADGILAEQALMMLGEVYAAQGDDGNAVQVFSQALNIPSLKRPAAERLLPILERQGRTEEAQYLFRNYLKGCC